jgi:hypothetical protein
MSDIEKKRAKRRRNRVNKSIRLANTKGITRDSCVRAAQFDVSINDTYSEVDIEEIMLKSPFKAAILREAHWMILSYGCHRPQKLKITETMIREYVSRFNSTDAEEIYNMDENYFNARTIKRALWSIERSKLD